jgi:hypothetical protein
MNSRVELGPKSPGNELDIRALASMRLKKLRRERRLVERAIVALTELSRVRESRVRRVLGN